MPHAPVSGQPTGAHVSANHHGPPASQPPSSVAEIPGRMVDGVTQRQLQQYVATMLDRRTISFPGAQPVSFMSSDVAKLVDQDFWVCEKSDGQRVLAYIMWSPQANRQFTYLIDRKNNYYQIDGIQFPSIEGPAYDTLVDGELLWDTRKSGRRILRLLLFDALVINGQPVYHRIFFERYRALKKVIYDPFANFMRKNPQIVPKIPFEVMIKHMDSSYHLEYVLQQTSKLEHASDGLIFTRLNTPYRFGTDNDILKWKPADENTIDFKLRLRFPPRAGSSSNEADLYAKPFFQLDMYTGRNAAAADRSGYEYFDYADMSDAEWEKMKASGEQYDDRIVECAWETEGSEQGVEYPRWIVTRIRADKKDGNHVTVVNSVLRSITDGVTLQQVRQARAGQRRILTAIDAATGCSAGDAGSMEVVPPGGRTQKASAGLGFAAPAHAGGAGHTGWGCRVFIRRSDPAATAARTGASNATGRDCAPGALSVYMYCSPNVR